MKVCKHCHTAYSGNSLRCPKCCRIVLRRSERIVLWIMLAIVLLFVGFAVFIRLHTNY